jgi:hypothetical protein
MNKFKQSYLILSVILLLGAFFTLGFSNITNNADSDLINQPAYLNILERM